MLLALAVIIDRPSLLNMIIVLGVADWPHAASSFETLSTASGTSWCGPGPRQSHARIIFRQILNLVSVIRLVMPRSGGPGRILSRSSLYFLGLGVSRRPAWAHAFKGPRAAEFVVDRGLPRACHRVTTPGINLLGNALRRADLM